MPFAQRPLLAGPMSSSESTATLKQGIHSPPLGRPRGVSTSTLRASAMQAQGQSRVEQLAHASTPPMASSLSLFPDFATPNYEHSDKLVSSFLSRSRSQSQSHTSFSATISPTTVIADARPAPCDHPASPAPASWWGRNVRDEILPRPWRDPPRRKGTVPSEQTDSWGHTRKASTFAIHILSFFHTRSGESRLNKLTSTFSASPLPSPVFLERLSSSRTRRCP
jgi:hypothetical protein